MMAKNRRLSVQKVSSNQVLRHTTVYRAITELLEVKFSSTVPVLQNHRNFSYNNTAKVVFFGVKAYQFLSWALDRLVQPSLTCS